MVHGIGKPRKGLSSRIHPGSLVRFTPWPPKSREDGATRGRAFRGAGRIPWKGIRRSPVGYRSARFRSRHTRESDRQRLISAWPDVRYGPLIEPACDSVLLDGAMIHIRYWTRQTVEDMLAAFPSPPAQRMLAEELQNCQVLVDPDGRLNDWNAVLGRLPDELMKAVIGEAQKRLPRFRKQWQIAHESDDRIHLYCLANQAVNDYLIALYIRHGRILCTPKWFSSRYRRIPIDSARSVYEVNQACGRDSKCLCSCKFVK